MARLFDCFSALFSFGLALDASIAAAGAKASSVENDRQRARALIEEARSAARAMGASARRVELASFAAIAWIDEILSRHPGWAPEMEPLQAQLFNSNNAHSEFFHHLSSLQAGDEEVREIYWHALACGFKGQYYFEDGDEGELGKLKRLHAQQLPVRPLPLESLAQDRITPQPYGVPDPPGPRNPQRRERALLRAAGSLALLVPLLYLLLFWLSAPRESPPTLAQRVEQQLQNYACADLSASVSAGGKTSVRGYVPQPEDMARVESEVRSLPGVTAASFDLKLRVWPHCEVVAILKPYQARNHDKRHGLQVAASSARDGRLREGDLVLIQAGHADHDGYLRVDYYTADGAVMHLNAGPGQPLVRAGQAIQLGRDIPSSWLAAPPFGSVLLTALWSPAPFRDSADRPPFELASAYLQQLRETVATDALADRLIADFVFLETVPR